ncbi:NAD-dependent epimerase/dehydratase family protein [Hydrogenophaga sp.]|uniref:NAD-dependent epimerase/dehydratase family protein n=1 Tax=Hydrogenophaga sp. TaxID=1904254 RepID=UPI002639C5F9|nr:NAD-dependent epimerase/dehydratase family protein [Hydrogenophaga sp.]MDM7950729.1 NAD-dependent epimerase/dehydratase family protein [Hydrogenophaga sp.]
MNNQKLKVGFIGAGYIASWHANALIETGVATLAAVCDPSLKSAKGLAESFGARAYLSLDAMLEQEQLDAVHVLSPPHLHCMQALAALHKGCHVLVEKPFALTPEEAAEMLATSEKVHKLVAVNHNFLALHSYQRLKDALTQGLIGKVHRLEANWHLPLSPLRSGPYGLWMLRSSLNLLNEIGPHLFAFVQDLLGTMSNVHIRTSKPIEVPGLGIRPQCFSICGQVAHTDVQLSISLVEGFEDRSVTLHGVTGRAELDFGADTFILHRGNSSEIILDPLLSAFSTGTQYFKEGLRNTWIQARSLNRKSPYALSMAGAVGAFYDALRENRPLDRRFSGESAAFVCQSIASAASQLENEPAPITSGAVETEKTASSNRESVVIIGGTGFIGRSLTRRLVKDGYRVRVFSRGNSSPFSDLGRTVEMVPVDLSNADTMASAMAGSAAVYHLAKTDGRTWEDYLENDVKVTGQIAEAALKAGVRRFIYTGTIASYDASDATKVIDESTMFGPMESRQLYGRSKAACEELLMAACKTKGLPLVIARPGIVIGPGGPLQHWGIGRWNGSSAVKMWGRGNNPLPLVLIDDVSDGLVRLLDHESVVGESFNLVGDPKLSAKGYFDMIFKLTGSRIRTKPGSLELMFVTEWVKYLLKRHVLRKANLGRPSRADWKSRAHLSKFSNQKSKTVLGWKPLEDPDQLMEKAILHRQFFGY